ncbi:MAG: ATP-binding cassette domain-containing protein [Acidimicrobiales bacterium]
MISADGTAADTTELTSNGAPPAAIGVEGLEKRYGDVHAVRGVHFEVHAGETFGFLGPNGAGKSTTINMLCTLARPTAGGARVAGYDIVTERDDVRREIGLVFQDPTLDTYLTAVQNLRFHGQLYGVPAGELDTRMRQVLEPGPSSTSPSRGTAGPCPCCSNWPC